MRSSGGRERWRLTGMSFTHKKKTKIYCQISQNLRQDVELISFTNEAQIGGRENKMSKHPPTHLHAWVKY